MGVGIVGVVLHGDTPLGEVKVVDDYGSLDVEAVAFAGERTACGSAAAIAAVKRRAGVEVVVENASDQPVTVRLDASRSGNAAGDLVAEVCAAPRSAAFGLRVAPADPTRPIAWACDFEARPG